MGPQAICMMEDEESQAKREILNLLHNNHGHSVHIKRVFGVDFQDLHRRAIRSLVFDDRISPKSDGYYELL